MPDTSITTPAADRAALLVEPMTRADILAVIVGGPLFALSLVALLLIGGAVLGG